MYRHRWEKPYYSRTKRGSYRAYQLCRACGTVRNPVTRAIVRRRGSHCWNAEVEVDLEQIMEWETEITRQLRFLESAGECVDWHHGSMRETRREEPSLFGST